MKKPSEADPSPPVLKGYRLVAPKWEATALSGEGARKYGGRWNSPGRPVTYLGGSRALAALELLVHLTTPMARAKPLVLVEVAVPASLVHTCPASALPEDWQLSPPTRLTQEVGDDWLMVAASLALRIPSAIIPEENNLLLNPLHPAFPEAVLTASRPFTYDPRLFQQ